MMDEYQLTKKVYYALLEDTSKAQQRILLNDALVARFGLDAIPTETMLRSTRSMKDGPETFARRLQGDQALVKRNLETIKELEAIFAAHDLDDLNTFARAMKPRFMSAQRKKKRAK